MARRIQRSTKVRASLIAVCVAVSVFVGVLGTMAYLVKKANPVTNTFQVTTIPNDVVETFDGTTKKNVAIKNTNTNNEPAYIRVAVVVNWAKASDGTQIHGSLPVEGTDYTISWNVGSKTDNSSYAAGDWYKGTDGYYYFDMPVAAGKQTQFLFTSCQQKTQAPDGYVLSVTIISQSIQANGEDASGKKPVILTWGTTASGCVSSVASNGKLTIKTS